MEMYAHAAELWAAYTEGSPLLEAVGRLVFASALVTAIPAIFLVAIRLFHPRVLARRFDTIMHVQSAETGLDRAPRDMRRMREMRTTMSRG